MYYICVAIPIATLNGRHAEAHRALRKVYRMKVTAKQKEVSPKVGDGRNRKGGISWGCLNASTSPPKERYAVSNDNVIHLIQPGIFDDQLTEVLRNGARALLAKAVEAEVT